MKLTIEAKHLNEPMRAGMEKLIERARHAHYTNAVVRINGQDEFHEADWIKHLVIEPDPE